MKRTIAIIAVVGLAAALISCGEQTGTGTLRLTTYGEDFIEKEIPRATGGEEGLVDDHVVRFSRFLVAFSGLRVADRTGAVAGEIDGPLVFDLHPAGPHLIAELSDVEARRWDRVGVSISPGTGARAAGSASQADAELMNLANTQ